MFLQGVEVVVLQVEVGSDLEYEIKGYKSRGYYGTLRWDQGVNIVNEEAPEVDESREKSGDRGHTDGWSHSSPEKIEAKILHLVSTHGVGKF